jgi:hypothetical protein
MHDDLQVYKICDHVGMRVEILVFSFMNLIFLSTERLCYFKAAIVDGLKDTDQECLCK